MPLHDCGIKPNAPLARYRCRYPKRDAAVLLKDSAFASPAPLWAARFPPRRSRAGEHTGQFCTFISPGADPSHKAVTAQAMEMQLHFSPDWVLLIRSNAAVGRTPCQGGWWCQWSLAGAARSEEQAEGGDLKKPAEMP